MAHCPQCGNATGDAATCPTCGAAVDLSASRPARVGEVNAVKAGARTMVGLSAKDILPPGLTSSAETSGDLATAGAKTIVGLPARSSGAISPLAQPPAGPPAPKVGAKTVMGTAPVDATSSPAPVGSKTIVGVAPMERASEPRLSAVDAGWGESQVPVSPANRTMLGMARPAELGGSGAAVPLAPIAGADAANRTLLGVARPGIAPLAPGVAPTPVDDDDGYEPASELGATIGANSAAAVVPAQGDVLRRIRRARVPSAAPPAKRETSKRAVAIIATAAGLAVIAVLVAVLWPSAPPLSARAKADDKGNDAVELTCATCADGTKLVIGDASAAMKDHVAVVPLAAPLAVGENKLKVGVERPNGGRKEAVNVAVNVAYRIRPDLSTLQGEKPSIQIVAESAPGTTIVLDGKPMGAGRGVDTIDVTADVSGASDEAKTLTRKVPYTVTPPEGPAVTGSVDVSVAIVPLHLEAPGPRITIDSGSFVLAGRTVKGAEVLAAGRPITVRPDGTFAQVMNVSAVGATQIDVRAKLPGMAPRIVPLAVRRVDSLDAAAKEFAVQPGIASYAAVAKDIASNVGKPIAVGGDVVETRRQGYQTILIIDVSPAFGCPSSTRGSAGEACHVRLVQGAENDARPGDSIRAYGVVSRAFAVGGHAPIPEVQVELALKGSK